jgi:thiamine biosynthesis protein ThiI
MAPDSTHELRELNRVLVRYGEISLKSPGIRRYLEAMLVRHLGAMLRRRNVDVTRVWRERGRIFIATSDPQTGAQVAAGVFGVVSASPVWTLPATMDGIDKWIRQHVSLFLQPGQKFAVRTRRTKSQAFTSQDLARRLGATIMEAAAAVKSSVSVDLEHPDVEVNVEVREKNAYAYSEVFAGPGGLPYGSQGTLVGLHSGGIDSPVAQWLLMKRGARVIPLYLDTDDPARPRLRARAIETARCLARWIPERKAELLVVPYRETLQRLTTAKKRNLTCLLCKRMMYRIAAAVAAREGAVGLVTGENLGQVASQTLTNLVLLNQATSLPVFRPLVGFDKVETEQLARRIGTYQVSAKDVGVCFAVPEHPAIAGSLADVNGAEAALDANGMVAACVEHAERIALLD